MKPEMSPPKARESPGSFESVTVLQKCPQTAHPAQLKPKLSEFPKNIPVAKAPQGGSLREKQQEANCICFVKEPEENHRITARHRTVTPVSMQRPCVLYI